MFVNDGKDSDWVDYKQKGFKFKKSRGWFRKPEEFFMFFGDHLTQVPIISPRKIGFLKGLWLRFAPEFWKRYKRHRSHLRFLNKSGVSPNDPMREYFGTPGYIATEKSRVMELPTPESQFNDFDPKPDWRKERNVRKSILSAIEECKVKKDINNG